MSLLIKSVILWPRDEKKDVRILNFLPNKINVITGQSQRGKSAIIPIIDYCLGARKCAIPVGIIREKTSWFGIILILNSSEILIARPEPGPTSQSSTAYYYETKTITKIPKPIKNSNLDAVKNRLNQITGLPSLDFSESEYDTYFKGRPSFRDMSAFEFQPQHIVANPYTLFFKADTYEHQEKLKTVFPLVLGAIDANTLAIRSELKDITKEYKKKLREYDDRKKSMDSWLAEIKGYFSQCREYGLLPDAPDPKTTWEYEDYIKFLKTVPSYSRKIQSPLIDTGSTDRAVKELVELKKEEDEIAYIIADLRFRLSKIQQFAETSQEYESQIKYQQIRSESVGWFAEKLNGDSSCPFCGSQNKKAKEEVDNLIYLSHEIEELSSSLESGKTILDKELSDIRKQLIDMENRLNTVRKHRKLIESKSKKSTKQSQQHDEINRFVGRLEQSLENLTTIEDDSELAVKMKELEARIKMLKEKLDPNSEKQRLNHALSKITIAAADYGRILQIERLDDPIQLDISNLTIKISSKNGREDYLWEIGSGANWMGYHISTLLALHELFLTLDHNYVPNFLIIDQPSQVFFPERWPGDPDSKKPSAEVSKVDLENYSDDIKRVNNIFRSFDYFLKKIKQKFQIIIVDHADEITWTGIDSVNLVERWRNSSALIPYDW